MHYFCTDKRGYALVRNNGNIVMVSNDLRPSSLRHIDDAVIVEERGFNVNKVADAFTEHLYEKMKEDLKNPNGEFARVLQENGIDEASLTMNNFIEQAHLDDVLFSGEGCFGIFTYILKDKDIIKIDGEDLSPGAFEGEDQQFLEKMISESFSNEELKMMTMDDKVGNIDGGTSGDVHQGPAAANVQANGNNVQAKINLTLFNVVAK